MKSYLILPAIPCVIMATWSSTISIKEFDESSTGARFPPSSSSTYSYSYTPSISTTARPPRRKSHFYAKSNTSTSSSSYSSYSYSCTPSSSPSHYFRKGYERSSTALTVFSETSESSDFSTIDQLKEGYVKGKEIPLSSQSKSVDSNSFAAGIHSPSSSNYSYSYSYSPEDSFLQPKFDSTSSSVTPQPDYHQEVLNAAKQEAVIHQNLSTLENAINQALYEKYATEKVLEDFEGCVAAKDGSMAIANMTKVQYAIGYISRISIDESKMIKDYSNREANDYSLLMLNNVIQRVKQSGNLEETRKSLKIETERLIDFIKIERLNLEGLKNDHENAIAAHELAKEKLARFTELQECGNENKASLDKVLAEDEENKSVLEDNDLQGYGNDFLTDSISSSLDQDNEEPVIISNLSNAPLPPSNNKKEAQSNDHGNSAQLESLKVVLHKAEKELFHAQKSLKAANLIINASEKFTVDDLVKIFTETSVRSKKSKYLSESPDEKLNSKVAASSTPMTTTGDAIKIAPISKQQTMVMCDDLDALLDNNDSSDIHTQLSHFF